LELNKHNVNITRGRLPEKADAQRAGHPKKRKNIQTNKYSHVHKSVTVQFKTSILCRWTKGFSSDS